MAGDPTELSQTGERAKLDATGEFFSVGAPLHAVRAGYVKRRADDLLYETIVSGRYAHVLAPDRSGKSSLMAATAARLDNNGCKVAILDLEQIGDRDGGTDAGRWYYSVAYRLMRQLRIRFDLQAWWQDKSILSNRQRLVEFYSEVVLEFVPERVVVFVDEIQCIENLSYADELLVSIRAAHNARTTDPDFSRLSFVLLGECDPVSLVETAEQSPFNVTQAITLDDFSRAELDMFSTELNLPAAEASLALDRIYYWAAGQPYLTQKLARAISREAPGTEIELHVDRIALHQLAGRAALHNEPHMSHIHRRVVADGKRAELLLNLYGKIRKGITVPADLGSGLQRRLMAVGLLVIDEESNLRLRNRLYATVFTTRWANENLPTHYRIPAIIAAAVLLITLIPFWYTQWLPNPYVRTLASTTSDLPVAQSAYENLKSFPGHAETAESLYKHYLQRRASQASDVSEIQELASRAAILPGSGRMAEEFEAGFWDRRASAATRREDRDAALVANLQSLALATNLRRQRAAALVSDDYPLLLATLPELSSGEAVFDPVNAVLTSAVGAVISQWTYTPQGLQSREPWSVTALEVSPLVRRVIVDREGVVKRIGLTLNVSHSRLTDLRIKIIAPSGRTIEVESGLERASIRDEIRIPARQLRDLIGESLSGTWSISIRDEKLGIAGQFVGWNLKLNAQGAVEDFQRGLNIPDPVERETDNIWFDRSGRYVVARATQSDSARIWDLAFAEPVRAVAVNENESLIGLDAGARRLVTATQDSVNLWDTASGDKMATLPIGAASTGAMLTPDGTHLFVERRGDLETQLERWSLDEGRKVSSIVVAGVPAKISIDAAAHRVAIADFDRAVRIWDFDSGELLAQFDLVAQPSEINLSFDGRALGAVYADSGISLWNVERPQQPLLQASGRGQWHLVFSPSGNVVAAGRPETGFRTYSSEDGRLIAANVGLRSGGGTRDLLAFSHDEQLLLTGAAGAAPRFWRAVAPVRNADLEQAAAIDAIWSPSADRKMLAATDGSFVVIGDPDGHVHIIPSDAGLSELTEIGGDVSFLGHNVAIQILGVDASGERVASAAEDNSVRIWRSQNGEPLPFVINVAGPRIAALEFSPDGDTLAILNATGLSIFSSRDGARLAQFDLGGTYHGIAFATRERIYVGGETGALQLANEVSPGNWQLQQVWQGQAAIQLLRASPRADRLILVDNNNLASQFILSEGRIAEQTLQLPSAVEEVVFDKTGTRSYIRTARWVHRASSSRVGLIWIDALLAPQPMPGAGIVLGNGASRQATVNRIYLPAARNSYIELVELDFSQAATTGLFGSRAELLQEWQTRLSAFPPATF